MAERPVRAPRAPHTRRGRPHERLTPHMQRVVLGGEGLSGFSADTCTDHYVKLLFRRGGRRIRSPSTSSVSARSSRASSGRDPDVHGAPLGPRHRELDPGLRVHGDEGALAGPWAANVRPGEVVRFIGPGGAYAPTRTPTGICSPVTRAR
ncbi:hypothetical protein GCM10023238_10530 [Streptomyces heliomycini]